MRKSKLFIAALTELERIHGPDHLDPQVVTALAVTIDSKVLFAIDEIGSTEDEVHIIFSDDSVAVLSGSTLH